MDYMGVPKEDVVTELENELAKLPKVQGGQLYASQRFNRLLMDAEKKAREFKDEFVSVEHLYLALLDEKEYAECRDFQALRYYKRPVFTGIVQGPGKSARHQFKPGRRI